MTHALDSKLTGTRWIAATALAVVLLTVSAAALNRSFCEQIEGSIFLSLTLASCAAVFLSVRPLREVPQLVCVALFLLGLQHFVLKNPPRPLPALALLGLGSLLLLAVRRLWSAGKEEQLLHDSVVPPLLFVLLGYFGSTPLAIIDRLHPRTLDLYLCSFDQSLGLQLSLIVGRVVLPSPLLTRTALVGYCVLPIAIMFAYGQLLPRQRSLAMAAFLASIVAAPAAFVSYNLIPACGPVYLLGSRFPLAPLPTAQLTHWPLEAVSVSGPRNAFPSLHLGWALLLWWYAERLSLPAKIILAVFLAGTVFATLGLGEHYFVDLVVAFPFALTIQAACALNVPLSNKRRSAPLVAGLVLMLGWVVLLKWGLPLVWINPTIPWLLVVATIGLTLFLQARLRGVLFINGETGKSDSGRPA
jgi:hypothetical protein